MIHQYILAAPKPGMSAKEFQEYWIKVHAERYAKKIPQIRRYMIDARVPSRSDLGNPLLPHQGIAEIWLTDEESQLASLQSDEFLNGARRDEPKWAAFWQTIVLDTTSHEILPGSGQLEQQPAGVKVTILNKRRPGLDLETFRKQSLGAYASAVTDLPGVQRYLQAHTRDGYYVFGEASFDRIDQVWFSDLGAAEAALASPQMRDGVQGERAALDDPKYIFSLTTTEHWIIGPTLR
jgi:EthD domain